MQFAGPRRRRKEIKMRRAKLTKQSPHDREKLAIVTHCCHLSTVTPPQTLHIHTIKIRTVKIALDVRPGRVKHLERGFGDVSAVAQATHFTVEEEALNQTCVKPFAAQPVTLERSVYLQFAVRSFNADRQLVAFKTRLRTADAKRSEWTKHGSSHFAAPVNEELDRHFVRVTRHIKDHVPTSRDTAGPRFRHHAGGHEEKPHQCKRSQHCVRMFRSVVAHPRGEIFRGCRENGRAWIVRSLLHGATG